MSVRPQFPYPGSDMISWIFPLPFVTLFACDIGQMAKFEFHLMSSPSAFSEYMDISRPAEYFI